MSELMQSVTYVMTKEITFADCNHVEYSLNARIKEDTYYYCSTCRVWQKISEII